MPKYNPNFHHRRSIRLADYDYTMQGVYFVTICTQDRQCWFGTIEDGHMQVNEYGRIVAECWEWLPQQYPYVHLDAWVVMPNHLHGIIVLGNGIQGGSRTAPTGPAKYKSLGRLIGAFKTISTRQVNLLCNTSTTPLWQRNYYEHIIRNENSLRRIRHYIINNPARWTLDAENPQANP
jgi:putative transposase